MPRSSGIRRDNSVIDDFPARPTSDEIDGQTPTDSKKGEVRTIVLFCFIYFFYGCGISIYGPLYPREAEERDIPSYIYGSVLATSHFVSILMYPVVCRMVSSVSCRISLSISIFMIGACRILFGTLAIIPEKISFITVSFAVQAVEGIGLSILMTSTAITVCSHAKDLIAKLCLAVQISLSLGFAVGPIAAGGLKEVFGYDIPFYSIGCLTVLSFLFVLFLLPQPDQQATYEDLPVIYWMKDGRTVIYFYLVFATFNYVGYLSVSLEPLLRQFHLRDIFVGLMFSIAPFTFCLTSPGWTWLTKKGCNSVMMISVGSILIFTSLVLLGPVPFSEVTASISNVSAALVLSGLGIACKSCCVIESSGKDLRYRRKFSVIQQQLIVPIMFSIGAFLGYFSGSLTAGIADFYMGYRKATLILFGLEICVAATAVILAFSRNYVSNRYLDVVEERQRLLRT